MGVALQRIKVLVATKPDSLYRVIEHLLKDQSDFEITRYAEDEAALTRHIRETRPGLVIVSSHYLHDGNLQRNYGERRSHKLILVHYFEEFSKPIDPKAFDAYLTDEVLVARLSSTVRHMLL